VLIDKQIVGTLDEQENSTLEKLQAYADWYIAQFQKNAFNPTVEQIQNLDGLTLVYHDNESIPDYKIYKRKSDGTYWTMYIYYDNGPKYVISQVFNYDENN
jgi:hypothetical protein